ncbi:MAG: C45 family autoproteolytic acyltransferase/hydrolase [Anaerolineae bacterium]|jgi:hypothetical protein
MNPLQQFEAAGSHFDVGFAIGQRFADQIHQSLDTYPFFQKRILPYHRSPEGQARYQDLLRLNRERFPDYLTELEGMAQGAGRSFEDLFLVNMRGEYAGYVRESTGGCFDCALLSDENALFGHNEDGSPAFQDNLYIVHAEIDDKPPFTTLSYPGFLCGNAFGFNAEGICFSIDNVRPRAVRVGLGRHLLARSLLDARSLKDAVARVTAPGRASGFSYTIGSIPERRIVHVEVSPQSHHVREILGCYVHANHYRELGDVEQIVDPSSRARVQRAEELLRESPPRNAAGVLSLLGDLEEERYPIFRTATPPDKSATFCTALFDLDARRLRIYRGHPTQDPRQFVEFNL